MKKKLALIFLLFVFAVMGLAAWGGPGSCWGGGGNLGAGFGSYGSGGWGWMIFRIIGFLIPLALILVAVIFIVRIVKGSGRTAGSGEAERILNDRYARGEIDEATFKQMKKNLKE